MPKNLTKCRRTDNNGQPQHTEENKNRIGKWALGNKKPNINGLYLTQTCDRNELIFGKNSLIHKGRKIKITHAAQLKWDLETNRLCYDTAKLQKPGTKYRK